MNAEEFKHDPNAKEWVDRYPAKKRKVGWLTGTIILLAIYVLSTGPVVLIAGDYSAIRTIYAPLDKLSDACPPLETFMRWYIRDVWRLKTKVMTSSIF